MTPEVIDAKNSGITFHLVLRTKRTPAWAAKEWGVWRKQYRLAAVRWDGKLRLYQLVVDTTASFVSAELFDITEFLREQTLLHRHQLWQRNCDRTSKAYLKKKKGKK